MHQTAKVSKVGRPRSKSVQKPKAKGSAKNTKPRKKVVRPLLQLELDVVEADQGFLGDHLPDLPPLGLEQGNNNKIQLNPPNEPLDIPAEKENQQNQAEEPNQVPNLPPEQVELNQEANQPPYQPN